MPTIGQLPAASAVSDSDELPIFQNGQTLAATRAQILAGMQPALAVPQNTLLGGVGPGTAAPVPIGIGANLTLAGTTLSATAAPFSIAALAVGKAPGGADIVPLGQGGANAGVSYASFMQGLAGVPGIAGGGLMATAAGGTAERSLAALAGNAVCVEDFGAVGDGVTDDSAAVIAAVASGNPVRFGARTYAIAGECDIAGASATLIGVPGLTVLTRTAQSKTGTAAVPAWISLSAATIVLDGIIFDANPSVTVQGYAVAVQSSCTKSTIGRCVFRNARASIYGWGLAFVQSDLAITQHHVEDCEFTANAVDGVWIAATDAVSITGCRAHDNARNGIYVDSQDPTFAMKIREVHIVGNTCWNNAAGIVVGNFNQTNTAPGVYGNANPDVLGSLIANNNCYANTFYGVSISGRNIAVIGNLLSNNGVGTSGAGIDANTGYCLISGNMVFGGASFGIDAGGAIYTEVSHNYVNGSIVGLDVGGSTGLTVRGNVVQDTTAIGISVQNVEADGSGKCFGIACSALSIVGNWINYSGGTQGIQIRDGAQGVLVADNVIVTDPGADPLNAISPYTDGLILRGNLLNHTLSWPTNPNTVGGLNTLVVPDLVDAVSISQSVGAVQSIVTAQAAAAAGTVTFVKVTNGGSGYTNATISFSGTGTGAAARVFVYQGAVVGIQMTANGAGYGAGTTAVISGNGNGASGVVQVGLPVLESRALAIDCLAATAFAAAGSSPAQSNWTGAAITVPAGATIDWVGHAGGWRAARFTQSDYVSPNGDGSMTLRTQAGDISLHPAGTGMVRIISDTEPTGAVELIGRGSPANAVSAPPGSTFRNLNGGAGATLWVKQAGTGTAGWAAIG